MESSTINMHSIEDDSLRLKATQWQLEKKEKLITGVVISGGSVKDYLSDLISHISFRFVTDIYLKNSELNVLPEWDHLKCLRCADLHGNKVISVPSSRSLRKLDISDNMMKTLHLSRKDFPKLTEVVAGSENMKFISFEMLGMVSIDIVRRYRNHITLPPVSILCKSQELTGYRRNPEKYLDYVDKSNLPQAAQWLVNEADFSFTEIGFAGQTEIFRAEDLSIWQGPNLKNISEININNCQLYDLPELAQLKQLETVLTANNNICDIFTLKHDYLKTVDVSGNPIKTLHLNFGNCPRLKTLIAGSDQLQVISTSVLRRIAKEELSLEIDDVYKRNLLVPPPYIVDSNFNKSEIDNYLDCGVFDVSWYLNQLQRISEASDIVRLLSDIVSKDERPILIFKMCKQPNLANKLQSNLDSIFMHHKFSSLEQLNLSDCDITFAPRLQHLNGLTEVNLSGNPLGNDTTKLQENSFLPSLSKLDLSDTHLTQLPNIVNLINLLEFNVSNNSIASLVNLESKSLCSLTADQNCFEALDFFPEKVPSLTQVAFGSAECQVVSFPIIQRASVGDLKLVVPDRNKQNLLIPPASILNNVQELDKFVTRKDITLKGFCISDPQLQYGCLLWLIESKHVDCQALDLAGETDFCTHIGTSGLEELISNVPTITLLDLSKCKLQSVPDIKALEQLRKLKLQDNKLENFDQIKNISVEEIDLEGNPIPGFDLDSDSLPSIRQLKIGSRQTKYFSFGMLEKIKQGKIEVNLSGEYMEHFVFPSVDCIMKENNRNEYVERAALDLTMISASERKEAFEWISKHSGSFRSLKISTEQEPSVVGEGWEADLSTCFDSTQSLLTLTKLDLINCGLTNFPLTSSFLHLEVVDVANNKIKKIETEFLPPNLNTLSLEGNPIKVLDIDCGKFPNLAQIGFGSKRSHYISTPVVMKLCDSGLDINVPNEYKDYLHLPPANILDEKTKLSGYIKHPEKYLLSISDVEQRAQALQWLFLHSQSRLSRLDFDSQEWLIDSSGRLKLY